MNLEDKPSWFRACVSALSVGFIVAASARCGGPPSCQQAVSNLYAMNCAFASGGVSIGLSDAISGCNTLSASVSNGSCSCGNQLDDLLNCDNGIGMNQCTDCAAQVTALDSCVSADSACSE